MPASGHPFRSLESYEFERSARNAVAPFLRSRGIDVREDVRRKVGKGESQRIVALLPDGIEANIRVRLCWRRDERNSRESRYSAAQLRARTLNGDWEATLRDIVSRNRDQGVTHLLLFQRNRHTEVHAALIPIDQVSAIWWGQHEVSAELIRDGALGRRKKNHAANGNSPTLWLQDDTVPEARRVAGVLWNWPGVIDLMKLPRAGAGDAGDGDTFDDCPGLNAGVGSDGGTPRQVMRSEVRRDPRVREQVRARARGRCERCGESRAYEGFLDVHHVMGAEKSDRVWTCVALCPNCHREAHASPDAESIRSELTGFASRFAAHMAESGQK